MESYPLDTVLEPMKPCKPDLKKPSHVQKLEQALRDDSGYVAEEKLDGCHYMMVDERFFSTRISDVTGEPVEKTDNFPHLTEVFKSLNMPSLILDGEICIPGKRSQDVITITGSLPDVAIAKQEEFGYVQYRVFDMIRTPGGRWIDDRPWSYRRALLEQLFMYSILTDYPFIILNPIRMLDKKAFLDEVINSGAEGIVLKRTNGLYECGKRPAWNWIKVKQEDTDDAIIMGFEEPTKEYTGKYPEGWLWWENEIPVTKYWAMGLIGAIVLGKYKDGVLTRIGTCSGMSEFQRAKFTDHPDEYIGKVAQIKMMERTNDGNYRHPAFVQMHPDKNAKECLW
jgi:ATP-dependent DNA ligase